MEFAQIIALSMGVAWASGINLYAAVLMLGTLGLTGHIDLPAGMEPIMHPAVIGAAGFMYCMQFFADKIPGLDTAWDTVHTFVRIPAGAVLAATAIGDVSMSAQIAAALIGGSVTAGTHFTKAGTRAVVNLSPEPVTNISLSVAEDVAVVAGLWAAIQYPFAFLALLVAFLAVAVWALPKLGYALARVVRSVQQRFGAGSRSAAGPALPR